MPTRTSNCNIERYLFMRLIFQVRRIYIFIYQFSSTETVDRRGGHAWTTSGQAAETNSAACKIAWIVLLDTPFEAEEIVVVGVESVCVEDLDSGVDVIPQRSNTLFIVEPPFAGESSRSSSHLQRIAGNSTHMQ
jgi:hypothetical protein